MPVYEVRLTRQATMMVELTQTAVIAVTADDESSARERALEFEDENGIDEWTEKPGSRQASNFSGFTPEPEIIEVRRR